MKYQSIFGSDKQLSASQHLAELICKKYADYKKVYLPNKFWGLEGWEDWKKRFMTEAIGAARLLKLYSPEAIIASLKHKHAKWVFSLYNKILPPIIIEEERKINTEKMVIQSAPPLEVVTTKTLPTVRMGKPSKLDKLRD